MKTILNKYTMGQITLVYLCDEEKHVELALIPTELEKEVKWEKDGAIDSLVQLYIDGDASCPGFAAGHTWRNGKSVAALHYEDQYYTKEETCHLVCTLLNCRDILEVKHYLRWKEGEKGVTVWTEVKNTGSEETVIHMLSSFSIGMITPFEKGPAIEKLKYYRIRSKWSAEGRIESGLLEDLQLEPSWSGHGVAVEKFGQVGSMPVRKFFPFIAIEDCNTGVFWAAQMGIGSSWQIELFRKDENLAVSGGIADFEQGHWQKTLSPGGCFVTPKAYLTSAKAPFDQVCQMLTDMQKKTVLFRGEGNHLPLVFNEFCTTWGNPSHDKIAEILKYVKGKGFDYFVIDAGWYADEKLGWEHNMGDWEVSESLFPEGLDKTVKLIRDAGMRPGIWFELEVVGKMAHVLSLTDHMLKRNGKLIQSGERFFWDMRDPWTRTYLKKKVIDFLNDHRFEYLKIDYNESIGIGCDGAESLGQGLYENILAAKSFFEEIHRLVPGICIELCSSGGHRLEPSFLNITDMASFSDAHEEKEIPVIAANVHRVMRPEKSQIWSVIRKTDDPDRICYSMVSACLGVMCISGDLPELDEKQWTVIEEGIQFYKSIDEIQKNGVTYYYGPEQCSYRRLQGWQAVLRKGTSEQSAYLIVHGFDKNAEITVTLPEKYSIHAVYQAREHEYDFDGRQMHIRFEKQYEAMAFLLTKC